MGLVLLIWGQYYAPVALSLSGAQSCLTGEVLSLNPATFPQRRWSGEVAVTAYLPAPELSWRLGGVAFSWDSLQALQAQLSYWGWDKITHWEGGVGYGASFFRRKVRLGVRARSLFTDFAEYGRVWRFTPDIGFQFFPLPQLVIGGYGYNLLGVGWGLLPGTLRYGLGIAYVPLSTALLVAELTQEGSAPPQIHTGFLYSPHRMLYWRAGIAVPLLQIGTGIDLAYQSWRLRLAYGYQPTLGSWLAVGLAHP
ncbi:MAG: hypothetical protein ABDH91_02445 [Bacteroidia bacterium]